VSLAGFLETLRKAGVRDLRRGRARRLLAG
jgi:hypothetical protein